MVSFDTGSVLFFIIASYNICWVVLPHKSYRALYNKVSHVKFLLGKVANVIFCAMAAGCEAEMQNWFQNHQELGV